MLQADWGDPALPAVHIAAGVHGDEPVGPWALLALIRSGLLDQRFRYRFWPCTNPTGYVAGSRTNAQGADINRSFSEDGLTWEARLIIHTTNEHTTNEKMNDGRRYVLALDLHEDYEADGFYCYEPNIPDLGGAPYSRAILDAIEDAGFPLQTLDHLYDLGYPSDPQIAAQMRTLERGRVLVNPSAEMRHFRGLPLSLFLLRTAADRYVTLETPRTRAWEERIAMHCIAVTVSLAQAADFLPRRESGYAGA
ncbi:MAG: succinylglutamate desuccinylase/aspartoacylase family protein [Candidatus Eremiobacteraeota bacterium]|nr:succinylglutamate desuccinylase/aspartoacylase family protein [Candidatus Eremiobacteraeota bacterium]